VIINLCDTLPGFSPEILRGGKSLDVYADTSLLQPSGDYSNGLVNCGYYEISGYRHAQSMTMRLHVSSDKLELATGRPFTSTGRFCINTGRPFTRADQCGENTALLR
jgi:hypothetical protein